MTDPATLFRSMTPDGDGGPRTGASARTLGVRPSIDVPGDAADDVEPGTGGMSATLGDLGLLPHHRRPAELGGSGVDPVFAIDVDDLGPGLRWRPDPVGPSGHGFVEPVRRMPSDQYQEALWATRPRWQRVKP